MSLVCFYITNNPDIALIAEKAGVDRVWVDLEYLGKDERQKGVDSVKSHHTINDVKMISKTIKKSQLQVRVNSWNPDSIHEINEVINAGAEIVMLPMWKTADEVRKFIDAVGGRAKTSLLLETKEAVDCLEEVLELKGIDEIHIGLNDLHLSYGLTFMFELLTDGTVEKIISKIKTKDIPYGFGGVSHLGDGRIPAEMLIIEHYRVGSTRTILSRGFCDQTKPLPLVEENFCHEMCKLREFENNIKNQDFLTNKVALDKKVLAIVAEMKKSINNAN